MLGKICGLTRSVDVRLCLELDFDFLGFIFHQQSPRSVTAEQISGFPRGRALRVGVFVTQTVTEIGRIMRRAGLDLAQLHGEYSPRECLDLGPERVIKVCWPERYPDRERFLDDLERFGPVCRCFLFDSGMSGGGHGRTIGPEALSSLNPPRPWLLAGGLTLQNIPDLVAAARPAGIDVNSGVEVEPGLKDHGLLRELSRLLGLSEKPQGTECSGYNQA